MHNNNHLGSMNYGKRHGPIKSLALLPHEKSEVCDDSLNISKLRTNSPNLLGNLNKFRVQNLRIGSKNSLANNQKRFSLGNGNRLEECSIYVNNLLGTPDLGSTVENKTITKLEASHQDQNMMYVKPLLIRPRSWSNLTSEDYQKQQNAEYQDSVNTPSNNIRSSIKSMKHSSQNNNLRNKLQILEKSNARNKLNLTQKGHMPAKLTYTNSMEADNHPKSKEELLLLEDFRNTQIHKEGRNTMDQKERMEILKIPNNRKAKNIFKEYNKKQIQATKERRSTGIRCAQPQEEDYNIKKKLNITFNVNCNDDKNKHRSQNDVFLDLLESKKQQDLKKIEAKKEFLKSKKERDIEVQKKIEIVKGKSMSPDNSNNELADKSDIEENLEIGEFYDDSAQPENFYHENVDQQANLMINTQPESNILAIPISSRNVECKSIGEVNEGIKSSKSLVLKALGTKYLGWCKFG